MLLRQIECVGCVTRGGVSRERISFRRFLFKEDNFSSKKQTSINCLPIASNVSSASAPQKVELEVQLLSWGPL